MPYPLISLSRPNSIIIANPSSPFLGVIADPMRLTEFDDPAFLSRLRRGDAEAYRQLVRRFHASLVRAAAAIIGSQAQAEEVVQDSWIAVYGGVGRFEGRSSLTTWIFSIVMNRARTRVTREGRLVGLDQLMDGTAPNDRGVPLSAFKPNGHWADMPRLWDELNPERVVAGRQLWSHVQIVIDALPAGQKAVIVLRDMEGRDAEETCELLAITAENQRVLLHRARCKIREEIDRLTGTVRRTAAPERGAPGPPAPGRVVRGSGGIALLCHAAANLTRLRIAFASSRYASRMKVALSHIVQASLNRAPPSLWGSTPRGLAMWKKIAPDMIPRAKPAPNIRVRGINTRTDAAISTGATTRRNGFSYPSRNNQSDRTMNSQTEPGFRVSLYCSYHGKIPAIYSAAGQLSRRGILVMGASFHPAGETP